MPYLLALACTLTIACGPAWSQDATINKFVHLSALVRSERGPRSWKTFYLLPGKETHFYYEYILPDGTTVTRVEEKKIKHAPDLRPLRQSHPNVAIIMPVLMTVGEYVGPALSRLH